MSWDHEEALVTKPRAKEKKKCFLIIKDLLFAESLKGMFTVNNSILI